MKKVLSSKEWRYETLIETKFFDGQTAFVFRNKLSDEVLLLQKVKFFVDDLRVVVHFDALRDMICNISTAHLQRISKSNPQLATHVNSLLKVSATEREPKCVLNALLQDSEGMEKYREHFTV